MDDKLIRMTREEEALSFKIRAKEAFDPLFRDRIRVQLEKARRKLRMALGDINVSPEEVSELDKKVRTYGKLLSVILKMDIKPKSVEDAFAEANVTAQKEADKPDAVMVQEILEL